MKSEKGFSLVELLITVAIITTLGAMAILYTPNMLASYRVRGATRLIYSDMQMARLKAIKEGKGFAVEFTSATAYCVKNQGTDSDWDAGCTSGAGDDIFKTVDLSGEYSGVNATSICGGASGRVNFNANGTAGCTGNRVEISKGSRRQFLCINTSTGNIRVIDPEPAQTACS